MTEDQIRLYALARTVVPPGFRIKSYREHWLGRFPSIGIKLEMTGLELFWSEELVHHAPDAMILREIQDALVQRGMALDLR